jgi:hypothetical protein
MILETKINGQVRQSQNTKDLIFDIPTLIETISMGITLMVSRGICQRKGQGNLCADDVRIL